MQVMCLIKPDLYFELGFTLETCIYSTTLNAGGREGILRLAVDQDSRNKGCVQKVIAKKCRSRNH